MTTEINIDYYEELKAKADKYDDCKIFIDLSIDMFSSFLNSKTPFPVPVISLKQFQELKVKTDAYDKIMELTGTNDARLELTDKGTEELRRYLDKVREVIRCKK